MKVAYLKSPAKINLFLRVGKKIKNKKLHNIQSLIYLTNLNDEIQISKVKKKKDIIKFTGKFGKSVKIKNNNITQCMQLLRKKNFLDKKNKYKINVKKNIPVFSGLGGGSSNAATIIKFFIKKKISEYDINYFSKYLGTDFRLFLKTKKIFQQSLLKIKSIKSSYNFYFLIVYPFLKCSTKEIYSKFIKYETIQNKNNFKKISRLELINRLHLEKNSLENIVISKFPVIDEVLQELNISENCQLSRITGSGSASFGLFLNKKDGALAMKRIKKRFPRFWCVLCKTI